MVGDLEGSTSVEHSVSLPVVGDLAGLAAGAAMVPQPAAEDRGGSFAVGQLGLTDHRGQDV